MRCGTAGHASTNHMACAYFSKLAGIRLEMVPYKGAAPALLDASTGQVQLIVTFYPESQSYIKAGKLVPLAVLGPARLSQLPEVATAAELGYEELQVLGWTCLMAPARTPPEIVQRLNAETIKVGTRADVSEWLEKTGAIFIAYTPEAFGEFVRAQLDKWRRISNETGIKAD
jgi:tripartite-type tricarboxylate transporter receptor subunit TctC